MPKKILADTKAHGRTFDTTVPNVNMHLKNLAEKKEIDEHSVIKDFLTTASDGKQYKTKFYSLEAIIAVGYRVNSERGTQFRQWATEILRNYIHKGYALDVNRMKYGSRFSTRYFDELYEEVKDIRTSERMMYQKLQIFTQRRLIILPKYDESKRIFCDGSKQTPFRYNR